VKNLSFVFVVCQTGILFSPYQTDQKAQQHHVILPHSRPNDDITF